MGELRTIDAIRAALDEELGRDPAVCILGEDVTMGGPFGATRGLVEIHGEARIRNTPISEATVMGLAVGAALAGRRPVVEIMFVDFITLALDQLVNHAAKLRYMSGGQLSVPLTIRVQGGAAGGMGAHHSQSLEAWLMGVPGLKVVAPSTPADAKSLLVAAIRDDDPVVVLEHRGLYFARGEVPEIALPARIGEAAIRRAGSDLTIVAWSRMVGTALDAAATLAAEGISAEVIDARTLLPLDTDTLAASVRRTGRLLVAHEAVAVGGPGGEVIASVVEAAGDALLAPPVRVGAPFAPVPAGPELEAMFVPSAARIIEAARSLVLAGRPARGTVRAVPVTGA
jgi:pyruvate/2-oxoglutarate/acetoin dehydrogenase E1 component